MTIITYSKMGMGLTDLLLCCWHHTFDIKPIRMIWMLLSSWLWLMGCKKYHETLDWHFVFGPTRPLLWDTCDTDMLMYDIRCSLYLVNCIPLWKADPNAGAWAPTLLPRPYLKYLKQQNKMRVKAENHESPGNSGAGRTGSGAARPVWIGSWPNYSCLEPWEMSVSSPKIICFFLQSYIS